VTVARDGFRKRRVNGALSLTSVYRVSYEQQSMAGSDICRGIGCVWRRRIRIHAAQRGHHSALDSAEIAALLARRLMGRELTQPGD
jgi:hypothetical protein